MRRYPPEFLATIPSRLAPAQAPASEGELARARDVRRKFLFPGKTEPWVSDIVRAARLLAGVKRYVEVGTYDKGNLAYLTDMLAPDAVLVDVDIEPNERHAKLLASHAKPGQRIHTVVGDSAADATLSAVVRALGEHQADAVFIDGNHVAQYHFSDYAMYSRLVRPGGLVLMHDVYWTGDGTSLGSMHATAQIDRLSPVYVVWEASDPVHRFMPHLDNAKYWGGVGIVIKA